MKLRINFIIFVVLTICFVFNTKFLNASGFEDLLPLRNKSLALNEAGFIFKGMRKIKTYLNRRFGRLLVVEAIEETSNRKNKRGFWLCQCDCGGNIKISGDNLYYRKSCGCLRKEYNANRYKRRRFDTLTMARQYNNHRDRAKKMGCIPLPKNEWKKIVFKPCFYCGQIDTRNKASSPSFQKLQKLTLDNITMNKYAIKINGIDRIDPLKNYELKNCVSCCTMCNRMKMNFSQKDFLKKVNDIYNNIKQSVFITSG